MTTFEYFISDSKMAQQFTPNDHIAFRNLKDAKLFALDIGGSLTKIAYYATVPSKRVLYRSEKDIRLEFYFEKNYFEISKNSLRIIFLSLNRNLLILIKFFTVPKIWKRKDNA